MDENSHVKDGIPTDEELEELGDKIGENWKKLGRRLVMDTKLQEIDHAHSQMSEKGYYMLKHWKQEKGSAATYQELFGALKHKLVQRLDLAELFCYINGPSTSQLPAGQVPEERKTGQIPGASASAYGGTSAQCEGDSSGFKGNVKRKRSDPSSERGHSTSQLHAGQVPEERKTGQIPGASASAYGGTSAQCEGDSSGFKGNVKRKRSDPSSERGNLRFKIDCASATSRNSGNQDPQEEREKVNRRMKQLIDEVNSEGLFDYSTDRGIHRFFAYLIGERRLMEVNFQSSSIKVIVKCLTLEILEDLWHVYCSGHLNEVAEKYLITENIKEELGMETIKLKTTILEEDYVACRLSLMKFTGERKELGELYVAGYPLTLEEMRKVVKLQNKMRYGKDVKEHVFKQKAEGQRVQLAYEKALREGFVNVYHGRILLIGQDRAGKTSLKKSLLGLPFDPKEQSTEGIEVQASTCQIEVEQVKNWHYTHENKPGSVISPKEISRIVAEKLCNRPMELEQGHFPATTEAAAMTEEHFKEEGGGLIGGNDPNKHQVEETEHLSKHGSEIEMTEAEAMINATSPPDDVTKHVHQWLEYVRGEGDITEEESFVSMDVWDFAGQQLYYASHPLFLSSRALYILVHNLSKPLLAQAQPYVRQGTHNIPLKNPNSETNLENLLSWLTTIHSITQVKEEPGPVIGAQSRLTYLRPPVLIVGTHADKQSPQRIAKTKAQIKNSISGKEYGKHVVPPLFSIDNASSLKIDNTSSLTQRWKRIKRVFSKGPKEQKHQTEQEGKTDDIQELRNKIMEVLRQEPYMGKKIPVRWFLFEKVIEALIAKQIYHRHLEQLQSYAKKHCFIEDVDEFAGMISFYHGLGMIIKHRSTVVLKAQWLIDLLKQLITIPHFDKMDPVHTKYWDELKKNGILCMEHIDHVFSKFIQQGVFKDDILDMMEHFGLIAKFALSPTDVKYFVPAQLELSPEDFCQAEPSHTDPCPLYVHFVHGFVPHGLFSQFVSRSIRWCCKKTWPMEQPKLYQNGACFFIGKQVHNFILICKKSFIKIVLRKRMQSHQVSVEKSEELPTLVREFVERTLQTLSQELTYLNGLQYEFCVACPYCHQGTDGVRQECCNHGRVSCVDEECFHLLKVKEDQQVICTRKPWDEEHPVRGLEKWFSKKTRQDLSPSVPPAILGTKENPGKSDTALNVTLLGSEWKLCKGGLSTLNRLLAIELAQHEQVKVTILVPQFSCSEEGKRTAESHNVAIREAERRPGYNDPLDWLSFPPRDLAIDIIVGHGGKLGKQAQVIRASHGCKWVQVVHTAPEELGMHKNYPKAISKGEEKSSTEVDLCQLADVVAAVGPKLREVYSSYLRSCGKHEDIIQLTPGIFHEFSDVTQAANDGGTFKVLTFGRGDHEDFSLKGYDIAAKAIAKLKDHSYMLIFVGAPDGKQEEVAENLLKSGISKCQLTVRKFLESKKRLKELFCEVDLVIMPSKTEGFGLTALEAMSAGLPILVSGNSGFGDTLCTLPSGKSCVVDSEEPKDWAEAIARVRGKDRAEQLKEVQRLQTAYEERFSWERQCEALVKKMWSLVHASETPVRHEAYSTSQYKDLQMILNMQHDVNKFNSSTDLLVELERIASDKGFVISDNEGSGNCMFYALSEQLNLVKGIKISHGELRQSIVEYLRKNPKLPDGTDLLHFIEGHQSWADYLTNMEQDGTWGDHMILYATANCYKTYIHVISSQSNHRDLTIRPDGHVISTNPLVLGHVYEVHYVSLQPKQGLQSKSR